ncbi:hypothetical protein N7456_004761 [Penicillium angulare]|uniref:Uncharacterized protein n=1 Tax=Penicillium angulare TaxID=116970 RepID=A0A9W9FX12_9EURO|nr:hypothetical protein N7456_004761 [Penicillium angulare]
MALQSPVALKYGRHQEIGRQLQAWMRNEPGSPPCPIQPTTLTAAEYVALTVTDLILNEDGIPYEFGNFYRAFHLGPCPFTQAVRLETGGPWQGCLAPRSLILESIYRSGGPYTSDISNMFYNQAGYQEDLKYVFVSTIENVDTKTFLENQIYTAANGLTWPPLARGCHVRDFYHNSNPDELQGILGTEIGKVVSAIALGRWPRGTHYIPYVSVSVETIRVEIIPGVVGDDVVSADIVDMLFVFEEIPPNPQADVTGVAGVGFVGAAAGGAAAGGAAAGGAAAGGAAAGAGSAYPSSKSPTRGQKRNQEAKADDKQPKDDTSKNESSDSKRRQKRNQEAKADDKQPKDDTSKNESPESKRRHKKRKTSKCTSATTSHPKVKDGLDVSRPALEPRIDNIPLRARRSKKHTT